ncbi:MAG: VCBS repeat-containing protein, partial [Planctomycetota bacterium]
MSHPKSSWFWLLAVGGLLFGGISCTESSTNSTPQSRATGPKAAEDDRSYLSALQAIDPSTNFYVNRQRAQLFAAQAKSAQKPFDRFRLTHLSADELAKAGDPAEALRRLDPLIAQLPSQRSETTDQIERQLRFSALTAALRLGELENCIQEKCCDSCVFPISGDGVHVHPAGSRRAIAEVDQLLDREPERLELIWLRNLLAMTLGEWPHAVPEAFRIDPEAFADDREVPRFFDIAPEAGVDVVGLSGGASLEDFDGDGHLDVFVTSWGQKDPVRYFRATGDGKFEDRTEAAGLAGITGGLNCNHADFDNDGDTDVLILRGAWLGPQGSHPNTLLRNDGGRFVDVTMSSGLLSRRPTQTAAWGDYDGDGDLDLFIGNETAMGARHACELFENQGDGTFVEVAAEVGLAKFAWVKGVAWGDFDNDNDLDLYVSVLDGPNSLYENLGSESGRPKFKDIASSAGVSLPRFSFPTWFFDYDQDGRLDILVGSYGDFENDRLVGVVARYLDRPSHDEGIKLYRNLGGGKFEDVSAAVGLDHPVLPMGSNFGDIDGDGWL